MAECPDAALARLGLSIPKGGPHQVFLLPENLINAPDVGHLYVAQDAHELAQRLRDAGATVGEVADLGIATRHYIRKSGSELWIGLVWILERAALPVVTAVLASWIKDWITSKRDKVPQQSLKVHIDLRLGSGMESHKLECNGATGTLEEQLDRILKDADRRWNDR